MSQYLLMTKVTLIGAGSAVFTRHLGAELPSFDLLPEALSVDVATDAL